MKFFIVKYPRKVLIPSIVLVVTLCIYFDNAEDVDYNAEQSQVSRKNCSRYPRDEDIFTDNLIWQVFELPRGFIRLLNAYLDDRNNHTIVRINASGMKLDLKKDKIFCQFWFENTEEPYVVQASEYLLMWDKYYKKIKPNQNHPYLITCPLDKVHHKPTSVSISSKPCSRAENKLIIIDNQPLSGIKKKFGVCTSYITFESRDFGIRFVEWVHMLRILGADKLHIYNRFVHPDVYELLQFFEKSGFVEVLPFLEPREFKMGTTDTLQINMLNDCFYRNKNLYKYIVVQDTDEIILPVNEEDKNWNDLTSRILNHFKKDDDFDSYSAGNFYFSNNNLSDAQPLSDVPSYFYMLQHIQRSEKPQPPGRFEKSFNNPDRIVSLIAHYALYCLNEQRCKRTRIPENIAQLNHYREIVGSSFLGNVTKDKKLWRFKDQLIRDVNETLTATGYVP